MCGLITAPPRILRKTNGQLRSFWRDEPLLEKGRGTQSTLAVRYLLMQRMQGV